MKTKKRQASKQEDGLQDERFASARYDPRFLSLPKGKRQKGKKKDGKASIASKSPSDTYGTINQYEEEDPRFADILKRDKRFSIGTKALRYDKRGKRQHVEEEPDSADDLENTEEQERVDKNRAFSSDSDSETSSSGFEDIEVDEYKERLNRNVKEFGIGAFAGVYHEHDYESEDDDGDVNNEYERLKQKERLEFKEATTRIAVVDLDWQHFTAVDILKVLRSFVPQGQDASEAVKRVTVYQSDFGMERMKIEEREGPGVFLRNGKHDTVDEAEDGVSSSEDEDSKDDVRLQRENLRAYEKSKLRYYFAIAEFESRKMAKYIYDACDGLEFDRSSSHFDLRFVAEDDKVEESRPVRDSAKVIPATYEAPMQGKSFYNTALQHTNVQLTWDDNSKERRSAFQQQFQRIKDNDMALDADIQAYLASESSASEDEMDNKNKANKLLSFIKGKEANGQNVSSFKLKSRDWTNKENDVDMVVTYDGEIDALDSRLKDKHERLKSGMGEPTVWETHLKEKRKKKLEKKNKRAEDNDDFDHYDANPDIDSAFDDPFFNEDDGGDKNPAHNAIGEEKQKQQKQSKLERNEEKKQKKQNQAELDLLLTSDQQLKALARGDKIGGKTIEDEDLDLKKGKKGKRRTKTEDSKRESRKHNSNFQMNVDDPRFSKMYTSNEFALDPTEPKYKQMPKLLMDKYNTQKKPVNVQQSSRKNNMAINLKSAVQSLKRKLKNRK